MDLQQLTQQLDNLDKQPPFDQWHPTHCGEIDIVIKSDGTWWHMGSQIKREKLVKLFANVLVEENGQHFLKTPAEKMLITVEETPFVITQWQHISCEPNEAIEVTSNLGHKVIISNKHPISVVTSKGEQKVVVTLHRRLKAVVHRNVYYQWIEIAAEKVLNGKNHLTLTSGDYEFSIGHYE
ncbi:DUF1285 domain-containing protein [Psychrosphaera algicola]|uniref:DUF1285 domain-containing protein n=1 Tax=Psychrosphaera algicola TaxID=3023714 RepID=A0ABT5FCB2_9GAMM|nr:DUF1285 domain-containing protein [Psychrosphaera sp. G1-22]MDC2889186.1 DUF1285 domain-containing protein [Psychrosphaera sp. G1-22]